jgi:hypothetical protein
MELQGMFDGANGEERMSFIVPDHVPVPWGG